MLSDSTTAALPVYDAPTYDAHTQQQKWHLFLRPSQTRNLITSNNLPQLRVTQPDLRVVVTDEIFIPARSGVRRVVANPR